jgi:hypothetical protein
MALAMKQTRPKSGAKLRKKSGTCLRQKSGTNLWETR